MMKFWHHIRKPRRQSERNRPIQQYISRTGGYTGV